MYDGHPRPEAIGHLVVETEQGRLAESVRAFETGELGDIQRLGVNIVEYILLSSPEEGDPN